MKFSAIKQGTRARERAELPLAGAKLDEATGEWIGDVAAVDLRPLLLEEIADVQKQATAYAKEKGVEPVEGVTAFDMAVAVYTVHAAALDPDAAEDAPFFDVPPEDLFTSEGLSLDAIVYLFERQQLWQSASSPRSAFVNPEDLRAQIERLGGGGDAATFFFVRLRPSARLICLHTMAALLASSPKPSSGSGTASSPASKQTPKRTQKRSAPSRPRRR